MKFQCLLTAINIDPRVEQEISTQPYIGELIAGKLSGPERSALKDADVEFHRREYERLRVKLEQAFQTSQLPETPAGKVALNDLLLRVRLKAMRNM
ncbi:MAG TPA: hypothetical protein PLD20_08630 [Blastocatellia bacterium]|nr:hypothetical protein [Blastocatellia bacterium]HMV81629.1 hypothetical protein [Blastocatellia bacterium]HMX29514.1 hypothetical protein [Blastocatellia bacterium]HMY73143.1 hypothetical protein [Blastocatellia bacterium]HMZ17981.1 hypothetical protein [Blastocatellia bacterium]